MKFFPGIFERYELDQAWKSIMGIGIPCPRQNIPMCINGTALEFWGFRIVRTDTPGQPQALGCDWRRRLNARGQLSAVKGGTRRNLFLLCSSVDGNKYYIKWE